ncbi:MAG: MFS transporter [Gammaproteobacteria bacterium]|nr:MFS transporter [Gammaproteobacteria bacterium]
MTGAGAFAGLGGLPVRVEFVVGLRQGLFRICFVLKPIFNHNGGTVNYSGIALQRSQTKFLYLNLGHFLDHLFMLVFATVAALHLGSEWELSYSELIPYATPGFIAFGVCALLAGWIADKWSREGMIVVFFIGIGISSIATGMANNLLQIAIGLTLIGVFAAIYHPVGLAMVVQDRDKTGMPLAINGVFGNLGVASAALLTGFLIDTAGWRSAFYLPGLVSIVLGVAYWVFISREPPLAAGPSSTAKPKPAAAPLPKQTLIRVFAIIFLTTAIGGLIFQSTTFALPRIFAERLSDFAGSATHVGWYAFLVFSLAAMAQLLIGYLVDHHSLRLVFATVALAQAVFFYLMTHLEGVAALVLAIAFMFVVFGQIPINDVLVGRMARSEWRSRAYALRYVVTFSVMASAVPLIGWLHANGGFSRLFSVLAVAAALIFCATLLLPGSSQSLGRPP